MAKSHRVLRRLKHLTVALIFVAIAAFLWFAVTTPRVDGLSIPEHAAYVASDIRGANDAYCMMRLEKLDAAYTPASFTTPEGCGNEFAVRASRIGGSALKNAPVMSCRLAETLEAWERDVLQPAALEHLGKRVRRIQHLGTYNCRKIRGSRRFMSQHAYANAIDVSGFVLEGGAGVSLERDWSSDNAKGRFLRALKKPTCDAFSVTLTPDKDAAHKNPFHLDVGLWRSCK
jgi:hypothetical protein